MKTIIVVLALALATPAAAQFLSLTPQSFNIPRTVTLNGSDGQKVGTATVDGARAVIRDLNGELVGTVIIERGRGAVFYDPHGQIIPREERLEQLLLGLRGKIDAD